MAPGISAAAAAATAAAGAVDEPLTQDEVARIPSASLPIGLQISHLLGEFTQLTIQLFAIISTTSPSALLSAAAAAAAAGTQSSSATEPIYEALAAVDRKLAALLVMYDSHRRRQRRIEALIRELGSLDSQWRDSALTLQQCLADLSPVIESGALDRKAISTARQADLKPETVLSYARLLAPFTSAPPASLFPPEVKLKGVGATDPTGRTLPAGAIPPFPTEATMRGGRLQFGSEGLLHGYLGETEPVGAGRRDSTTGALIPPEVDLHGAATTAQRPADDTAARLEHEAKLHGAGLGGEGHVEGEGVSDFVFDLDLNPDM
ncbi:hypothetical protein JCM8115_004722 [Rhodotorula mucilaginosa]